MHAPLRIFSTKVFRTEDVLDFITLFDGGGIIHLLISDGIMTDFRHAFPAVYLPMIMVQRVLTSYQLQRILMDSDDHPHYIAILSDVMESWASRIVESIYDIMKIKSYYHGCPIYLNIIGSPGVFARYLGNRTSYMEVR